MSNLSHVPDRCLGFFSKAVTLASFPVFVSYLCLLLLSPLWKKVSSPLQLKQVMIVYNFVAILLSATSALFLALGLVEVNALYGWSTNKYFDYGLLIYTISKNVELLDSVFMILRHRARQISFLHVFHHSSILILGNYAYAYTPYPPVAVCLGLNSLVHVFLYAYYMMAALSNQNVTWKKNLTQLQIAQFLIDLVFAIQGYLYHNFCVYSLFYCSSMIVLFGNFYYGAYIKLRPEHDKKMQ